MAAKKGKRRTTLARNIGFVESEVGDQIVLFDPSTEKFYALNLAAKLVFKLFNGNSSIPTIENTLLKFFKTAGLDKPTVKADVATILKKFEAAGLVAMTGRQPSKGSVKIKPHGHPLIYEAPQFRVYSATWMQKNHPQVFLDANFSDTWSPGCS